MNIFKLYCVFLYHLLPFKSKYSSDPKKAIFLKKIAEKYKLKIFVETGTYFGDTLFLLKKYFILAYSIELSKQIFDLTKYRFIFDSNVKILNGNSEDVLKNVLTQIPKQPVLFWLDAHYSSGITARGESDTPIEREIEVIKRHFVKGSVITIDDANLFIGKNSYPTLNNLVKKLHNIDIGFKVSVKDNIIIAE